MNDCGEGVLSSCFPVSDFSFFGIRKGYFSLTFCRPFTLKLMPLDALSLSLDNDLNFFSLSGGGEGLLLESSLSS